MRSMRHTPPAAPQRTLSRRRFLTLGAAAGAAAGVARQAPSDRHVPPSPEQGRPAGYAETEHVREYYRKARF